MLITIGRSQLLLYYSLPSWDMKWDFLSMLYTFQIDDKAVRRFGAKDGDAGGAGWLGTAASFLAKSFYW